MLRGVLAGVAAAPNFSPPLQRLPSGDKCLPGLLDLLVRQQAHLNSDLISCSKSQWTAGRVGRHFNGSFPVGGPHGVQVTFLVNGVRQGACIYLESLVAKPVLVGVLMVLGCEMLGVFSTLGCGAQRGRYSCKRHDDRPYSRNPFTSHVDKMPQGRPTSLLSQVSDVSWCVS